MGFDTGSIQDSHSSAAIAQLSSLHLNFSQQTTGRNNSSKVSSASAQSNSIQITISRLAQSVISDSEGLTAFGGIGGEFESQKQSLIGDIFGGVREQLSFTRDSNVSKADKQRVLDAGNAFRETAEAVLKEANGRALNDSQVNRLAQADDKFHAVIDSVHGNQQGGGAFAQLDAVFAQIEQLFEQAEGGFGGGGSGGFEFSGGGGAESQTDQITDATFSLIEALADSDNNKLGDAVRSLESSTSQRFGSTASSDRAKQADARIANITESLKSLAATLSNSTTTKTSAYATA